MAAINLLRPEQITNTIYLPYVSTANAAATIIHRAYIKYINHLKLHHHQHVTTTLFPDDNPNTSHPPASTVKDPFSTTDTDCMHILQQNNATIIAQLKDLCRTYQIDNIDRLLDDNG
jgi:hypothetical protein